MTLYERYAYQTNKDYLGKKDSVESAIDRYILAKPKDNDRAIIRLDNLNKVCDEVGSFVANNIQKSFSKLNLKIRV